MDERPNEQSEQEQADGEKRRIEYDERHATFDKCL